MDPIGSISLEKVEENLQEPEISPFHGFTTSDLYSDKYSISCTTIS